MYGADIMKESSSFYLKSNPDNRWSFKPKSGDQFAPKLSGQFDRIFHSYTISKEIAKYII